MVKKAIIFQVVILSLMVLMKFNSYFFDIRLKKAQNEIDFEHVVREAAFDTAYFNRLNFSNGKYLIIGFSSYSDESTPLFYEIIQNQQKFNSYKVVAISPFGRRKFDTNRDSAFLQYISFIYSEIKLDIILRAIPFTTIPEYKTQSEKAKVENRDIASDYPVVIVLNKNKIVWAKKRVASFSEIDLND